MKEKACVWITLKDSTRLAAKLWIPVKPNGDEKEKFPAILGEAKAQNKEALIKIRLNFESSQVSLIVMVLNTIKYTNYGKRSTCQCIVLKK